MNTVALTPVNTSDQLSRVLRAWLITGISDALFSSLLNKFAYGSTATRVWQGVASTVMGSSAIDGGTTPVVVGVLMHFGVALAWTIVFYVLFTRLPLLRMATRSPVGVLALAIVYGPIIWLVMSMLVIPALVHRPTAINFRWWVQLVGHIPFVAGPIVFLVSRGEGEGRGAS